MSPITHFLASWTLLERTQLTRRDGALVGLIGMAPDLDGIGIVVDFATRTLGLPETNYYQDFHRSYGHGLPAAIVFTIVVAALANDRWRAAIGAFVSIHLHFLCDVLGSRGTTVHDNWPITYFAPISDRLVIKWGGQWPLVGWQNISITLVLIIVTMALAVRDGYSPVGLFSKTADAAFINACAMEATLDNAGDLLINDDSASDCDWCCLPLDHFRIYSEARRLARRPRARAKEKQ